MSAEYAVFNAEGCVERGFRVLADAKAAATRNIVAGDEDAYGAEMCPDHEEQPRDSCEDCDDAYADIYGDEDDDDEDGEDW